MLSFYQQEAQLKTIVGPGIKVYTLDNMLECFGQQDLFSSIMTLRIKSSMSLQLFRREMHRGNSGGYDKGPSAVYCQGVMLKLLGAQNTWYSRHLVHSSS